jgi:nanoRNase/pAp phosphatase (c-di-AMP/oligoRNAs hydrolase)
MEEIATKPMTGKVNNGACADSFRQIIERKKQEVPGKPFAVFTHAFPDPDAIGSMMGMSWLLNRGFGVDADLFYFGEVSHPQNTAILNLLDPQLKRVQEEYDPTKYAGAILVDTIPINAGVGDLKVEFDIVMDHHKEIPNGGFSGLVVHNKTGSCCSIVFKMMRHFCQENWFEDDNAGDSRVATAMIAGIVNDTDYMVSDDTTEMEFEAYSSLFEFRNPEALKNIIFFKRPKFWTDTKAAAAQNAEIDDEGYAIVGLGLIPESQRDLIADMASEMVSWASVETAIVFALVGSERVEGSVRSQNNSLNVSEFCKRLGGRCGTGGGKLAKGAYRYSLGGMSIDTDDDEETKRQTWELIRIRESKRIAKIIKR